MSAPKPDEFGRFRIQTDTGAHVSVARQPLKGEKVLDEPASDLGGDALPTTYPESLSSKSSGQQADTQKESRNG